MATATRVELSADAKPSFTITTKTNDENAGKAKGIFSMTEAVYLAGLCRTHLNTLNLTELADIIKPSQAYTADDILALPLDKFRVPDILHDLPSRKSTRHALAVALAALLYPVHDGSLTAIIRYDADRVRLRAWAVLQRRYDLLKATRNNGRTTQDLTGGVGPGVQAPAWASRITNQGPWDPAKRPISLDGVEAIPMPVQVSREEELAPFMQHLRKSGNHELAGGEEGGFQLHGGNGEPYYGVRGAEFRKGVVYEDGRMDLCKMVVGPDHIWRLMDSLRTNEFVRHFLLGNNIIGPSGAKAIADFVNEFPERMETWYLAGNCIDGESFKILVDALIKSRAISDIWLKRNPLGPDAAGDVYRLITNAKNLQTLDLDQTQLGDRGIADLFNLLAAYTGPEGSKLPLRQLYLNGNGISTEGAAAIGKFLASPHCSVTSIYMSCNPLGNEGANALAEAVPKAPYLARLFLQSVGVSTQGAMGLFKALTGHPGIRSFDLGQAYATEDLGQAYNYVDDATIPFITEFLKWTPQLQYFNLGHCATSPPGLLELTPAVLANPSLLYFVAISILADSARKAATFIPSKDTAFQNPEAPSLDQIKSDKVIREHLEANVQAQYGANMSYIDFMQEEKRWLVNDKSVRKIDSVYRNRDAGMARRGLLTLIKEWKEGDDTLERIMKSTGPPMCSLRKRQMMKSA